MRQAYLHVLRTIDESVLWERQIAADTTTWPLVLHETIYVGTDDGTLLALQRSDRSVRWRYKTQGTCLSSPVVSQDVIHVGANDGSVYALRMDDGTLLWSTALSGESVVRASLALNLSIAGPAERPPAASAQDEERLEIAKRPTSTSPCYSRER